MKFKLDIDFEDLEINEGSISEQLQKSIQDNIVYALKKEIQEKTLTAISSAVRNTIEEKLNDVIAEKIADVIQSATIKKQYGSDATTFQQYIEDIFKSKELSRHINDKIEKDCKMFVESMKKTYDLNFASHIVKNMQANNLLKDDVAKLLIP